MVGNSTTAPKKAPLSFRSPIYTSSYTRMENQETQQSSVPVAEFNDMKNELSNLAHMMSAMMRRSESQPSPLVGQGSGSSLGVLSCETSVIKKQNVPDPPSRSISHVPCLIWSSETLNLSRKFHQELARRPKRRSTSSKDNLTRSKEQTLWRTSISVILSRIEIPPSLNAQILKSLMEKSCSYAHLKVYGVTIA